MSSIFANKLKQIREKNSLHYPQQPMPTGNEVSNCDDLGRCISAAAENITATREKLLTMAEGDPALKFALYSVDARGVRKVRKWSEMLYRLSIAQKILFKILKGEHIIFEDIEVMFPDARTKTLQHVVKAMAYATSDQVLERKLIVQQLVADPERYPRLLGEWGRETRNEYVKKMLAGFLNCHLVLASPQFRQRMNKKIFIIETVDGDKGIYTEITDSNGNTTSNVEYLDVDLSGMTSKEIGVYMNTVNIYSPRQSMKWFINELFETLMFDFAWQDTVKYAQFVYNTLCRLK
jgi:hypothetical protein